jgi:hypothetical protein
VHDETPPKDAPEAAGAAGATPAAPAPVGEKPPYRGPDRRIAPTPMLSRFLLFGRRRGGRRAGETDHIYVDRPGGWVVAAFAALTILSVADAWFTLYALSQGAEEANPIMLAALSLGTAGFVVVKTVVTLLGGAFLCLHKNWALGRVCLWFALAGYGAITAWHVYGQTTVLK